MITAEGEAQHILVKTDYASELKEIPKVISYKVTFKVENGAWNDGTTEDQIVTLAHMDDEDEDKVLK